MPETDLESLDILNTFLKNIKQLLNDYSHSNIDAIMQSYLMEHHSDEMIQFNKFAIEVLISILECILIALINSVYNMNIVFPSHHELHQKYKDLPSLRYVDKKIPREVKEFLRTSEHLSVYLVDKVSKMFDLFQEVKSSKLNIGS